jgi:uncharacterized protein (UPF0332 family)
MLWDSYVGLAADLIAQRSEAAKRSGVSRAYYGAFNEARRFLEGRGMPIGNHRTHDRVWRAFRAAEFASSATVGDWRLVGDLGADLFGLRNLADYADVFPGIEKRSERALEVAGLILRSLDELEFS